MTPVIDLDLRNVPVLNEKTAYQMLEMIESGDAEASESMIEAIDHALVKPSAAVETPKKAPRKKKSKEEANAKVDKEVNLGYDIMLQVHSSRMDEHERHVRYHQGMQLLDHAGVSPLFIHNREEYLKKLGDAGFSISSVAQCGDKDNQAVPGYQCETFKFTIGLSVCNVSAQTAEQRAEIIANGVGILNAIRIPADFLDIVVYVTDLLNTGFKVVCASNMVRSLRGAEEKAKQVVSKQPADKKAKRVKKDAKRGDAKDVQDNVPLVPKVDNEKKHKASRKRKEREECKKNDESESESEKISNELPKKKQKTKSAVDGEPKLAHEGVKWSFALDSAPALFAPDKTFTIAELMHDKAGVAFVCNNWKKEYAKIAEK